MDPAPAARCRFRRTNEDDLSLEQVSDFLTSQFEDVADVEQMVEGEESQALSFVVDGSEYVIRINARVEGS
jgi:hypothetical protein